MTLKIDEENELIVISGKRDIVFVAEALRHCCKQDAFYDDLMPGWREFMGPAYDELFEAFVRHEEKK